MILYEIGLFEQKTIENKAVDRRKSLMAKTLDIYSRINKDKGIIFSNDIDSLKIKGKDLIDIGYTGIPDSCKDIVYLKISCTNIEDMFKTSWTIQNMNLKDCIISECLKQSYNLTPKGAPSDAITDITKINLFLDQLKSLRLEIHEYDFMKNVENNTIITENNNKEREEYNEYCNNNLLRKKRLIKPKESILLNHSIEKCSICLDYISNPVYTNSCKHVHCLECLMKQSKFDSRCPLCKLRYNYISYHDEKNKLRRKKIKEKNLGDTIADYIYEDYLNDQVLQNLNVESEDEACDYCMTCGFDDNTEQLLICDICNYNVCHTYCDGLFEVPHDTWKCKTCRNTNNQVKNE